jgi:predicted RNase H-like HicB family nuclease
MAYRIAIEDMEQDHFVAWALDLPGCFSTARTQEEAFALAPASISRYFTWLKNYGYRNLPRGSRVEVEKVENFKSYVSEGMYVVNAFFEDDKKPLSEEEIEVGLWVLKCTREDLFDTTDRISDEKLNKTIPNQVHGTIMGILEHIAWSEWWYFDRLNLAFPREQMPSDKFEMLKFVRKHTFAKFPELIDSDLVIPRSGERWSPRKLLRRTLWHERDHTHHIEKLMAFI